MTDALLVQVVIAESDPVVAEALAKLAFEVFPAHAEVVVGRMTDAEGAKRLLDRFREERPRGVTLVLCATALPDGGGFDVLDHARRRHPEARVVLLTDGEREHLSAPLAGVDGIVAKPFALRSLRVLLDRLARDPPPERAAPRPGAPAPTVSAERVEMQEALAALEAALEAVARSQDRLARAPGAQAEILRRTLREVEILAVEAQRRFLETERRLAHEGSVDASDGRP